MLIPVHPFSKKIAFKIGVTNFPFFCGQHLREHHPPTEIAPQLRPVDTTPERVSSTKCVATRRSLVVVRAFFEPSVEGGGGKKHRKINTDICARFLNIREKFTSTQKKNMWFSGTVKHINTLH